VRPLARLLSVLGFFLSLSGFLLAQTITSSDKYVPGHVLVKFRPNASRTAVIAAHRGILADDVHSFSSVEGLQLVHLPASVGLSKALAAYRSNPDVLYAEPDYIVRSSQTPNDPLLPGMWSLLNTGQSGGTAGADIKATSAWNLTTGSSGVVIAVLDTGIDYAHPDLAANIFNGPICPGGVVCHGVNETSNIFHDSNDPFDDNGHGTHVSGTIGAVGNNNLGVTGINWNVTILPCKFLNADGAGAISDAIKCLDFIKALKDTQGINIVASNNSWGGTDFSQALQDAIDRQRQSGILFIAAAGNDFTDNDIRPFYPAGFALPNIIAVAATDRTDHRAFFSNIGHHTVHIGAPGQEILSTLPGGKYGLESGTSMAAPHVTGVVALLAAQDPTRDWRAIKNLILSGGDPDADLAKTVSGRRLNAFNSLTCANSTVQGLLLPTTDVVSATIGAPIVLSVLNINCAQPAGAVQATVSPGGQTIQLADGDVAPDVAAGDGVYTGTFTPGAAGVYTLTFSTGDILTVQVLNGYQAANTAFTYRTITGTNLNLGDEDVASIASPFPIAFGNGSFTQLWVSANGTISFSGAFSTYLHEFIPTGNPAIFAPVQASTLVAPFWDDLLPLKGTAQNVFWDVTGTAPNRELVVEWRDVKAFECSTEPDTIKFQVVFFENSSNVLFSYADAVFSGSCTNHDRGGDASVGVQVSPQTGTLWGFEGQTVNDGMAVLWQVSTGAPPLPPTPVITSLSPASVTAFGPDFILTVNGSNFVPGARVRDTGGRDRITTFINSTQLNVLIPAADIDLFQTFSNQISIGVRNPGDISAQNVATLAVNNPSNPTISSVNPAVAAADGLSFILDINGSNFTPFTLVTWNGQTLQFPAPFSQTHIQIVVPGTLVTAQGRAQLQVINPAPGGGLSAPFTYTIGPASAGVLGAAGKFALVQHRSAPGAQTTTPNLNAPSLPTRFLGWNYASKMGPQYTQHFVRPYGSLFTAPATEKLPLLSQAGPGSSAVLPGALPGLALNDAVLTGFLPTGAAVGDFNHDGHLDYVISNGGSNDLWIYFGNGDGTFKLPQIISLKGLSPVQVITADLRGIGTLDLIVAEPDSVSVGVLLGNGDGTFGPETLYFSPGPVFSVAVGNFRGTGHLDIVAGIIGDNLLGPVAFFPGDGTGRFSAPITSPTNVEFLDPWATFQISVADFDGDGLPDLVVTDFGPFSPGIVVYKSMGNGTFKNLIQLLFSDDQFEFFTAAATGDLNHDGCADVVAVDDLGLATIALGNCDGTFRPGPAPVQFGDGDVMANVTLADVDGDGNLDVVGSGAPLVISGAFGGQSGSLVSVARGNGAGGISLPQLYRVRTTNFALATGDFNGDLRQDIVVASQDTDSATVLLNNGTGTFPGPQGGYVGWAEPGSTITGTLNAPDAQFVGDLNGDGHPDLFHVDFGRFGSLPINIAVSLNDGTGHFGPDIKSPILDGSLDGSSSFGDLITGDFRNLGRQDLIVVPSQFFFASGKFFNFLPSNGDGHFGVPIKDAITNNPGTLAAGDFNGDGKLDFVMLGFGGINTFFGNGDGTFIQGPNLPLAIGFPPAKIYVADVNGDGKLDLLVPFANPSTLVEFLGNGDGSFAPGKTVIVDVGSGTGFGDPFFGIADLNHDGHLDVVVRNPQFFAPINPVFKIYMGQPDGTFVLTNTYTPYSGQNLINGNGGQTQFTSNFVADFNGDGNPDIASFQSDPITGGYVQFMLGNGDGTFTPTFEKFPLTTRSFFLPGVTLDLNGDGKADLAELDGFTSSYNIILSTTGHPFQIGFASLPVIGPNGVIQANLSIAAAQDTVLQLSSSDPAVSVPGSITVPAGSLSTTANFTVGSAFNTSHTFSVTATDGINSSKAVASIAVPGGAVGLLSGFGSAPFRAFLPGQTPVSYSYGVSSRGGYQTTVSLHCENLPPGVTCQFDSTRLDVPAGGSAGTPLVLNISSPLPVGNYTFNVIAADAAITDTLQGSFQVGDFGIQLQSDGNPALPSGEQIVQVNLSSINNYQGSVNLTCSGLPAGASCGSGGSVFGIGTSVVTGIAVDTANVPVGNYPFVINGGTGFTTHSTNAVLHVGDFGTSTITPSSATLNVGQSATFNLKLASVNGFNDQINLFCSATVNGRGVNGVGCSFSPSLASFDASGNLNSQMTVKVTAFPQSAVVTARSGFSARWGLPLSGAILIVLVMLSVPKRQRKAAALTGVCLLAIVSLVSCGGGGGGTGGGSLPTPTPTPPPQPTAVKIDVFGASTRQQIGVSKNLTSITVTVQP
jgi:subtilisin family serine protease